MPPKLRFILCLIFVMFLGFVLSAFAGGSQEDGLATAERLITEKRFNEAIKIITEVMRTDPERFDQGEALLSKVREGRDAYNDVFNQLTEMLKQPDINDDEAYAMVQKLKDLDNNPNVTSVKTVSEATSGIVFKINDRQFRKVKSDAETKIKEKDYWGAVRIYLSGFTIHKEQFVDGNYGTMVNQRVDSIITDIEIRTGEFLSKESELRGNSIDVSSENSKEADTFYQHVKTASDSLILLGSLKNALKGYVNLLEGQRKILLQGSSAEDIPFLSTIRILTNGKGDDSSYEGITGVIDAYWDDNADTIKNTAFLGISTKMEQGKEFFLNKDWNSAVENFNQTYIYALSVINSTSLNLGRAQEKNADFLEGAVLSRGREYTGTLISAQIYAKIAKGYLSVIKEIRNLDEITEPVSGMKDIPSIMTIREILSAKQKNLDTIIREWDKEIEKILLYTEMGFSLSQENLEVTSLLNDGNKVLSGIEKSEALLVHQINKLYFAPLQEQISQSRTMVVQGKALVEGTLGEISDISAELRKKYPKEAIDLLTPILQTSGELREKTVDRLNILKNEKKYVIADSEVTEDIASAEKMLSDIISYLSDINEILKTAETNYKLAEFYKDEGNQKFEDSKQLLQKNDFKGALNTLNNSSNDFADSLKYQEDPVFRVESDRQKQELLQEITREWQNLVVRQVRAFLNQAGSFYQREEFGKAQNILLKAENVWNDANAETNEEIGAWLTKVENALKATTGRVIEETNPLYNEMTNLLNLAQNDFLEAKKALDQKDQNKAETFFENAEEKISYIKDAFPINEKAGVLLLRIDQLRDPVNFKTLFKSKYDGAVKLLGKEDEAVGYSLLKDLEKMNPGYPGIKQVLFDFEVNLGMRERPPDPKKIAVANRLYGEAQKILSKATVTDIDLDVALDKLNEAYRNNSGDKRIIELKDRTQLLRGGSTTILDSNDMQQFRIAEQLFLDHKYYEALAVVQKLLQKPQNQRYAPLTELKRRIDSFI